MNLAVRKKPIILKSKLIKETKATAIPEAKCKNLIEKMIMSIGLSLDDISIREVDSDSKLSDILFEEKPSFIISYGSVNSDLLKDISCAISDTLNANEPTIAFDGIPVWPIYHPAHILKDYSARILPYWESWLSIKKYIEVNNLA